MQQKNKSSRNSELDLFSSTLYVTKREYSKNKIYLPVITFSRTKFLNVAYVISTAAIFYHTIIITHGPYNVSDILYLFLFYF